MQRRTPQIDGALDMVLAESYPIASSRVDIWRWRSPFSKGGTPRTYCCAYFYKADGEFFRSVHVSGTCSVAKLKRTRDYKAFVKRLEQMTEGDR